MSLELANATGPPSEPEPYAWFTADVWLAELPGESATLDLQSLAASPEDNDHGPFLFEFEDVEHERFYDVEVRVFGDGRCWSKVVPGWFQDDDVWEIYEIIFNSDEIEEGC